MDVLVVTFLSLVDFYMISMPMVSATASYYTLMSFEWVQPMKNLELPFQYPVSQKVSPWLDHDFPGFLICPLYMFRKKKKKKQPQVVPSRI